MSKLIEQVNSLASSTIYEVYKIATDNGIGATEVLEVVNKIMLDNLPLLKHIGTPAAPRKRDIVADALALGMPAENLAADYMRDVPKTDGFKVTADGDVYSPHGKISTRPDTANNGHLIANIKFQDGTRRPVRVDKLLAMAFGGKVYDKQEPVKILHLDGDITNCKLENLKWEM